MIVAVVGAIVIVTIRTGRCPREVAVFVESFLAQIPHAVAVGTLIEISLADLVDRIVGDRVDDLFELLLLTRCQLELVGLCLLAFEFGPFATRGDDH